VSLVGYTNAGKSTLLNALADEDLLAEDRLFATLDATTRTVELDTNKEALVSDTVGFIRKLPHRLIESFKSTLDEVRTADVLVHVVDVTHPNFREQMEVVGETLGELDSGDKPILTVFNKVDALDDRSLLRALRDEYPDATFVSALRGIGLQQMKEDLLALIEQDYVERVAYIPVSEPEVIAQVHRLGDVIEESYEYDENGGPDSLNGEVEEAQAVARIHFRAAPRNDARLREALDPLGALRPAEDEEAVLDA